MAVEVDGSHAGRARAGRIEAGETMSSLWGCVTEMVEMSWSNVTLA